MNASPDPDHVPDQDLQSASVASIMVVPEDTPVSDEWAVLDGASGLSSFDWPEFTEAMKIQGPTFDLPLMRQREGFKSIIKLGTRRVLERPDPSLVVDPMLITPRLILPGEMHGPEPKPVDQEA